MYKLSGLVNYKGGWIKTIFKEKAIKLNLS